MPLILTCYVSVSNCLKYYLRKPFSLSPVISLGRQRHYVYKKNNNKLGSKKLILFY